MTAVFLGASPCRVDDSLRGSLLGVFGKLMSIRTDEARLGLDLESAAVADQREERLIVSMVSQEINRRRLTPNVLFVRVRHHRVSP